MKKLIRKIIDSVCNFLGAIVSSYDSDTFGATNLQDKYNEVWGKNNEQ